MAVGFGDKARPAALGVLWFFNDILEVLEDDNVALASLLTSHAGVSDCLARQAVMAAMQHR
jgi:hypothetical protein